MNNPSINTSEIAPLYLPDERRLTIEGDTERLFVKIDDTVICQANWQNEAQQASLKILEHSNTLYQSLWLLAYGFIASGSEMPLFELKDHDPQGLAQCLQSGLLLGASGNNRFRCDPALFWQLPEPWLVNPTPSYPLTMTMTNGKYHPTRPPKRHGEVYRRFIPDLNCHFSLQTASDESHAALLHRWMNNPRVDKFWQESGDLGKHIQYLHKQQMDAHNQPLIGYFGDQPFAYFEAYWAKEDHISPFYEASNFDRGIHMLVGEEAHRGPHKVKAWLTSLAHYLFLQDPRTQVIVSEPRADNGKMIHYLQQTGFFKMKEFDFPHKRAAMMCLHRSEFFQQHLLA